MLYFLFLHKSLCCLCINTSLNVLWKISGEAERPNGNRKNLKRPKGVENVVKFEALSVNSICQNPLLASNVENIVEPAILRVTHVGTAQCSRIIALSLATLPI